MKMTTAEIKRFKAKASMAEAKWNLMTPEQKLPFVRPDTRAVSDPVLPSKEVKHSRFRPVSLPFIQFGASSPIAASTQIGESFRCMLTL